MTVLVTPKLLHPDFINGWRKPTGPVSAKRGKFVAPLNRSAVDIVSGQRGTLSGTAEFRAGGLYRSGTTNNSGYVSYPHNAELWGSQFTVFLVIDLHQDAASAGSLDWHPLIEKSYTSSGEPFCSIQISRQTAFGLGIGELAFQWNNSGSRTVAYGSVAMTAGRYAIVAVVESGRQKAEVYTEKGGLFDTASDTVSGAPTIYSAPFNLSDAAYTGYTGYTNATYELVGVDNRAWSDAEMQAFGRAPFSYVLEPAFKPYYAVGGGTVPIFYRHYANMRHR